MGIDWRKKWVKELYESSVKDYEKGRDITVNCAIKAKIKNPYGKIPSEEELENLLKEFVCKFQDSYVIGISCKPSEVPKKYEEIKEKLKDKNIDIVGISNIIAKYNDCGLEIKFGSVFNYDELKCVEEVKKKGEIEQIKEIGEIGKFCPYKSREVCKTVDRDLSLTKCILLEYSNRI